MAYRFNGSGDKIFFSAAPLASYANGAITLALYLKRNVASTFDDLLGIFDSGSGIRVAVYTNTANNVVVYRSVNGTAASGAISSTSIWYLVAVTFSSGGAVRYHTHNGTSWTHSAGATHSSVAIASSGDRISVSSALAADYMAGDVVCAGIKKADSSDLAIETLSLTDFSAWKAFGFDWLVGFDSSFVSAGKLQDQATPGTGDEVSRSGTSMVADPPGWSWATAPPPDSTEQNPSHTYAAPGTYTVTLVASNANGSDTEVKASYIVVVGVPQTRSVPGVGSPSAFGAVGIKTAVKVPVAGVPTAQAFGIGNIKYNQIVPVRGLTPGYDPTLVGPHRVGQAHVGYEILGGYQQFGVPDVRILGIKPTPPIDLIIYPTTEADLILAPTDETDEVEEGEWIIRPTIEVPM